ncbi:hypothetical protein RFI_07658 [Reticulomyxa filosa]|uniref:Uncharacterized protein n=1 Tax=Reticulomyxa filosa TaxID=46433 RepID=X6NU64_RETFI|nr:hypothetical protein RFI_07658 [Reticulomyxa filosa]|eukprot:ETO29463.1 hypothetical protein RFI_07658 [Reticulomyxa filosa]
MYYCFYFIHLCLFAEVCICSCFAHNYIRCICVYEGNTLDHELRERFLIFRPDDHVKIIREDTWYWKFKPPQVKQGKECCSPYIVCAHNYKYLGDAKLWYPILQATYNQPKNWSDIPLPPRPRTFIYDKEQVDFEIDEYFNTKIPPRGQRVYLGPGKEWQCWQCNLNNPKEIYRTDWWDGPIQPNQQKKTSFESCCWQNRVALVYFSCHCFLFYKKDKFHYISKTLKKALLIKRKKKKIIWKQSNSPSLSGH